MWWWRLVFIWLTQHAHTHTIALMKMGTWTKNTKRISTTNRIYSFRNTFWNGEEALGNGNDISVVERVAHLWCGFPKMMCCYPLWQTIGYANAWMALISSLKMWFNNVPSAHKTFHCEQARTFVSMTLISTSDMFIAKWHLKPHRDAFKTMISHGSIASFKYNACGWKIATKNFDVGFFFESMNSDSIEQILSPGDWGIEMLNLISWANWWFFFLTIAKTYVSSNGC